MGFKFYSRFIVFWRSALYEQGGALDSQTSDTQWLSSFIRDESPSNGKRFFVVAVI